MNEVAVVDAVLVKLVSVEDWVLVTEVAVVLTDVVKVVPLVDRVLLMLV